MKKRFRRIARLLHKAGVRNDNLAIRALREEMRFTLQRR